MGDRLKLWLFYPPGEHFMNPNLDVRIVTLEPMRVATLMRLGEQPELQVLNALFEWAKAHQIPIDAANPRRFGFDNPPAAVGTTDHGYELWMVVGPEIESDEMVKVKDFSGGLYAVTRCENVWNIPDTWMKLTAWVEQSPYRAAHHQWLEESIKVSPEFPEEEFILDLYFPITQ